VARQQRIGSTIRSGHEHSRAVRLPITLRCCAVKRSQAVHSPVFTHQFRLVDERTGTLAGAFTKRNRCASSLISISWILWRARDATNEARTAATGTKRVWQRSHS
jgi:hypothetical protein